MSALGSIDYLLHVCTVDGEFERPCKHDPYKAIGHGDLCAKSRSHWLFSL